MLHMLFSVSVESDVIRKVFVLRTALSASGHLASDARRFVSLFSPMLSDRTIFFHWGLIPLSAVLHIRSQITTDTQH